MSNTGVLGPIVALSPWLADMTPAAKDAEIQRLTRKVEALERAYDSGTVGREMRMRIHDAYHVLHMVRRHGGNPQHLPVYYDDPPMSEGR